jgi:hypothetical protein
LQLLAKPSLNCQWFGEGCEARKIMLAQRLNLSRTRLGRKFAEAEAMGSLGWSGPRGKSPLWVSADFRREYHGAQAVKLAIIDAAYEACVPHGQRTAGEAVSA